MGKKLNQEAFINACKEVHNDFYDYSKVKYINSRSKIKILCPVHGAFEQVAMNHLYKKQNCPKCSWEKELENRHKYKNTKEDFFSLLSEEKRNKYDYSKLDTYQYNDFGTFICPIHGEFRQRIRNHIESNGCYECGRESFKYKQTTKGYELIEKLKNLPSIVTLNIIPGELYPSDRIVEGRCEAHGKFEKSVYLLLKGVSCTKCRFKGYSRTSFLDFCKNRDKKSAIFYIIKIYSEEECFIKIGITSNTIKERYRKLLFHTGYRYEIVKEISGNPRKIWDLENFLKRSLTNFSYKPAKYFMGNTECFLISVLESDLITKIL